MNRFSNLMSLLFFVFVAIFIAGAHPVKAGTVAGGGGTTVPAQAAGLGLIHDILRSSRAELHLFFLKQQSTSNSPLIQRLQKDDQIFKVLKSHGVFFDSFSTCLDADGVEMDGSVHSPAAHSICISALRLAEKLDRAGARSQTLALVAHEYSHLLGFTEDEADVLQKEVLKRIDQDSGESVSRMLVQTKILYGMLRGAFISHKTNSETQTWNYLCYVAGNLTDYWGRLHQTDQLQEFSFYGAAEKNYFLMAFRKSDALFLKSCGESDYHPDRKKLLLEYRSRLAESNPSYPVIQTLQDFAKVTDEVHAEVEKSFQRSHDLLKLANSPPAK